MSLRCASSARSASHVPADPARPHSRDPEVHHGDMALRARVLLVMAGQYRPALHLTGQRASLGLPGGLYLQGGAHAPQVLQVSAGPVHSLKPQASHGARTRHARHSQAAIASDTACAVNFMQPLDRWLTSAHLQRLRGAARRCAAPGEAAKWQLDVPQAYDRGRGAQVACGERRVACLCGRLAGCLRPRLAKNW